MKKICKLITISAASILIPAVASYAGTWVPTWGVGSSVNYDDNFFMSDNEQSTWEYSVRPELSLKYLTPSVESSLDAKLAVKRYSEFSGFDSEDPSLTWDNSFKTQRATWTLDFGYAENSQRDSAELDTGEFNSNSIVETINIEPGVSYQLTEKDSVSLGLSHIERDYDTGDFSDNENQSVNLGWQHKINQRWTTTLNATVSKYEAERPAIDSSETDYDNVTVGIIYQYSPAMSIQASAGRFTSDRHQIVFVGPAQVITDEDNSGSLATIALAYDQEKNTWSVNVSKGLYPSSRGEVEERDSFSLAYERRLSERSSAGVLTSWSDTSSTTNPREHSNIEPFYRYSITPRLKLNTSYSFRAYDRNTGTVESNKVKAGLRYSF